MKKNKKKGYEHYRSFNKKQRKRIRLNCHRDKYRGFNFFQFALNRNWSREGFVEFVKGSEKPMKVPLFFWCQVCFKDLRKEDGSVVIYKPVNLGLTTGFSSNICSEKCYNKMFHEKK